MAGLKLTDLEPQFLVYSEEDGGTFLRPVDRIEDAQGVKFLCPKCFAANGGPKGTHAVICWSRSRGTPDKAAPGPGRWRLKGRGYDDLTLKADAPSTARSVQLKGGCAWHGFITDGLATSC